MGLRLANDFSDGLSSLPDELADINIDCNRGPANPAGFTITILYNTEYKYIR